MEKPVIIFGAKGIAKSALEIFQSNQVTVYGFLDDDKSMHEQTINDIPVLGLTDDHGFTKLIGQKCEAFIASDDYKIRTHLTEMLIDSRKVMPVNAIHAKALVAKSADMGHGNFINAGSIIGSGSVIGQHCIIHSSVIIEQDVVMGDFVQIGAGSIINAGAIIEKKAFIGSGVVIIAGVTIGAGARIGAGSVVIANVGKKETVFGNPAAKIKK
jgi:sugar O-acyltransferase (sialic acid O-acetyltransferase NeuD family)|tara:strand:+ start:1917 stop:2555 length:639 start_codon:yes stop_codon:yes gene_type:complete